MIKCDPFVPMTIAIVDAVCAGVLTFVRENQANIGRMQWYEMILHDSTKYTSRR